MSTGRPVTVFCADDQLLFRNLLRELVAGTPGFVHVGEASCGADAISAVAALGPDIVVMDVRMPGLNGCEAARILAERRNLIIILTSADLLELTPTFSRLSGQVAFVPKQDLCPDVLLDLWQHRGHAEPPGYVVAGG